MDDTPCRDLNSNEPSIQKETIDVRDLLDSSVIDPHSVSVPSQTPDDLAHPRDHTEYVVSQQLRRAFSFYDISAYPTPATADMGNASTNFWQRATDKRHRDPICGSMETKGHPESQAKSLSGQDSQAEESISMEELADRSFAMKLKRPEVDGEMSSLVEYTANNTSQLEMVHEASKDKKTESSFDSDQLVTLEATGEQSKLSQPGATEGKQEEQVKIRGKETMSGEEIKEGKTEYAENIGEMSEDEDLNKAEAAGELGDDDDLDVTTDSDTSADDQSMTASFVLDSKLEELMDAAKRGDKEKVEALIQKGIDVNERDFWASVGQTTALHYASKGGHSAVVELLLANRADIEATDSYAATALHNASRNGHLDVVGVLLSHKGNIDARDQDGATPLHHAAQGNHPTVIDFLLDHKANIEAGDEDLKTPVYWAAKQGSDQAVSKLLQRGADVESNTVTGWKPIHTAARDGHIEVMSLLLERNADINAKTLFGNTPLHYAYLNKHKEVIEKLMQKGANVMSESNETIWDRAVKDESNEMVEFLLERSLPGAGQNVYLSIAEWFIDPEIDPSEKLFHDIIDGNETRVKVVLNLDWTPNLEWTDDHGWTSLHHAAHTGNAPIVQLLLEKSADTEARTKRKLEHFTPLLLAAISNDPDVVHLLLEKGAEIEAKTKNEETALHLSAGGALLLDSQFKVPKTVIAEISQTREVKAKANKYDSTNAAKIVHLLLKNGADIAATTKTGYTAIHIAEIYNRHAYEVLLNPPAVTGQALKNAPPPPVARLTEGEQKICGMYNSFIVNFYSQKRVGNTTLNDTDRGKQPVENQRQQQLDESGEIERIDPQALHVQSASEPVDTSETPAQKVLDKQSTGSSLRQILSSRDYKSTKVLSTERIDWQPRIRSVHEVIRNPGLKAIINEAQKTMMDESGAGETEPQHLFTWVHVPANNVVWVKDLIHKMCLDKGLGKTYYQELMNFISSKSYEHQGPTTHASFMKPGFQVVSAEDDIRDNDHRSSLFSPQDRDTHDNSNPNLNENKAQHPQVAIYMPFLNFETDRSRKDMKRAIEAAKVGTDEKRSGHIVTKEVHKIKTDPVRKGSLDWSPDTTKIQELKSEQANRDFLEEPNDPKCENPPGLLDQKPLEPKTEHNRGRRKGPEVKKGRVRISTPEGKQPKARGSSRKRHNEDLDALGAIMTAASRTDSISDNMGESVDHREKCTLLTKEYLQHHRGHLHLSRTLDQFYYDSIDTSVLRDEDQVVWRFSNKHRTTFESPLASRPHMSDLPEGNLHNMQTGEFHVESDINPEGREHPSRQPTDRSTQKLISGSLENPGAEKADTHTHQQHPRLTPKPPVYSENPKIFTVDQLWLWIIDEYTIISSFPQRWAEEEYREPKVLEVIRNHLKDKNRTRVDSVYKMAALIVSSCINFADNCTVRSKDSEETFFQVFASSVSNVADQETKLFLKFKSDVKNKNDARKALKAENAETLKTGTRNGSSSGAQPSQTKTFTARQSGSNILTKTNKSTHIQNSHNEYLVQTVDTEPSPNSNGRSAPQDLSNGEDSSTHGNGAETGSGTLSESGSEEHDISSEIEVLKEIKDIQDELNIILKVLQEQESIATRLLGKESKLPIEQSIRDYYWEKSGLENRIRQVNKMNKDADRTHEQVDNLLDLKQKQANIDEAIAAVQQGKEAIKLSSLTAGQNRVVLGFTIVTVMFLPASFMTSLFALNVTAFPRRGDVVMYDLTYIFSRLGAVLGSTTCLVLAVICHSKIMQFYQICADKFRRIGKIFPKGPKREALPSRGPDARPAALHESQNTRPDAPPLQTQEHAAPSSSHPKNSSERATSPPASLIHIRDSSPTPQATMESILNQLVLESRSESPETTIQTAIPDAPSNQPVVAAEKAQVTVQELEQTQQSVLNDFADWVHRLPGIRARRKQKSQGSEPTGANKV